MHELSLSISTDPAKLIFKFHEKQLSKKSNAIIHKTECSCRKLIEQLPNYQVYSNANRLYPQVNISSCENFLTMQIHRDIAASRITVLIELLKMILRRTQRCTLARNVSLNIRAYV